MKKHMINFRSRKLIFLFLLILFLNSFLIDSSGKLTASQKDQEMLAANSPERKLINLNFESNNVTEYSFLDDNLGIISDVSVNDNYLFVALGSRGFAIFEITSNALNLVTLWDDYQCENIFVRNNYVYTTNVSHINILDITTIDNPFVVCNVSLGLSSAYHIEATDNFVYISDLFSFSVYNVTDFNNPSFADSYGIEFGLVDFQVSQGIAYVKDVDSNLLRILNVTDPSNINQITSISYANLESFDYNNNFLFLSDQNSVEVYNVTDFSAINQLDSYTRNATGTNTIRTKGDYLYIQESRAIFVIDINNKSELLYISHYEREITTSKMELYDTSLFCYSTQSLEVIDISDPNELFTQQIKTLYGSSRDVFISGNYAFVADDTTLEIIDISDLLNPIEVGSFYDENGSISHVFVRNNYAYILINSFGLKIVDITDKTDPKEISSLTISGLFYDFHVDNEYAYIAQGAQGLTIIDIFYPENPQLSLAYNEIVDVQGLAKLGNYLFVGAGEYMYILNIVNAYDPTIVSKYTRLDADYTDIYVTSTYAFVVSLTEGYDVIRHTDKNNPVKVGHYFTSALPNSIFVEGDYVYLYDDLDGLLVIKSSNVAHPRKVASYSPEHSVYTFLVRAGYIYLAGSTSGLRILRTNPLLTLTGKIPLDSTVIILGLIFISALGVLFRKKRK